MGNLFFIKLEIYIFILSFLYLLYYSSTKFYVLYFKLKKIIRPEKIENTKSALNKVSLNIDSRESIVNKSDDTKLSQENKDKLTDIVKRVKINTSKWFYDFAKNLIVEWLSIDKFNKDLNFQLATIYEKEGKYLNSEYIYRDLLEVMKVDYEVMKKLWFVLALQNKFEQSLDIYESIHKKKMADDEVIDILAELAFNIQDYKKALKYSNLYLVSKPRDVDKLFIKAKCLDEMRKTQESYIVYKRILELQPYNTKVKDIINDYEWVHS